jgi:hypothetical protein
VKISREGDFPVFTYADEKMGGAMSLKIGPEINRMTDYELLDRHNGVAFSMQEMRETYEHVAVEIPIGKPQIEFNPQCHQW